jgi:flagellar basal-body rod protein FlgG
VRPPYHDLSPGPIEATGRPLDVAIRGTGFFAVSDGNQTRYTREGSFTINAGGELVLTSGQGRWRVLDRDGETIRLDPEGPSVSVSPSGIIRQGPEEIAELAVKDAPERRSLRKMGETLFEDVDGTMETITGQFVPESLEGSNFDVMSGLASMIEASRAYELNANILKMQDEATGVVVNTLGRVV